MRILFIDESINRIGGVERTISSLANQLSMENEVEVISEQKTSSSPFYSYNRNIKIFYLIDTRNYKTNGIKEKKLKYYFFRLFEKINDKIILNKKIKKFVKNIDSYDVIIFGRVWTALHFLKKIKKMPKPKIIVRDSVHLEWYSKSIQLKMKKIFPILVNKFVVSSNESIKNYQSFFNDNGKMNIVKIYNPLGINPIVKYSYEKKTIVSIGRLDKEKGYENLIKAADLVFEKYPNWKLKIYGNDYFFKEKLNNFRNNAKHKNNIELLPATNDVVSVLNNSSIFVFTSRQEGYANALVESLSCGIPAISYNWLMGVEEIIKDGKNGFIVPLKNRLDYFNGIDDDENVINLARKIEYLIENKNICDKISKEAAKIADSRNINKIVGQWLKIIN